MTSKERWLLSAGHHHLFHVVAPIVARARRFQRPLFDSGEVDAAMIISGDAAEMVKEGYPLLGDLSKVYPQAYAVRITAATGEVVRN